MADSETASLVMSSGVLLVAGFLGWKEWRDRRNREIDLTPEDAHHFRHQDTRRAMGIVVMALLAISLVVGSRLPPKLGNKTNPQFVAIWLGVFVLILFLLALALVDWVALRVFARRHRNQILRDRIELLKPENRKKKPEASNGNGHADGPFGDLFR